MTLEELRRMSIAELEALYADAPLLDLPRARFRGVVLARLRNDGAKLQPYRFFEWLGFKVAPWGIDFVRDDWFFFSPVLGSGHFTPTPGRSRWRDTQAIGLRYDVSKLPAWVKNALYDEVKPLSDELCLGIGGINAEKGAGDHFFFALLRRPD